MSSKKITKQTILIVMFLITLRTLAQADVITVPGTATASVSQSGEIVVETGFFNTIKDVSWRQSPTPAAGGAGYHFSDWNITFPVNLPLGSRVTSAAIIWTAGTEHFSIQTREVDFVCGGPPFCDDSFVSIENPGLTQSFVNFVRSGTITHWFAVPPPRATTNGSVDLMPLGIGVQLEAGEGIQLFGNTEIGLANGVRHVSPGFNSKTFIQVDGTSTLNISASLRIEFTPPPALMPPHNESILPQSADSPAGSVYIIRTAYTDPNGVQDISNVVLRAGDSNSDSLYAQYSAISNKFYLLNEAGTGYLAGYAPGSPSVISHSRGALDCSLSKVETIGNELVVTWAFVPSEVFVGTHSLYQLALDRSGAQTDLERTGSWTVMTRPTNNLAPSNVTVTPVDGSSPAGVTQLIKTTYTDPNGVQDITNVVLRVGDSNNNAVYAQYSAISRKFYLLNDAGTAYLEGFAPGSTNIITNSRGGLDCSLSKVEVVGNQLIVTWAIVPSDLFAGMHNLYQLVRDRSAAQTDLEWMSSWTITR